jgi:CubicO group peptidase (beta-lactamase class C family)
MTDLQTHNSRFRAVASLMSAAVAGRVAPAVSVEAGNDTSVLWRGATGRLTYASDSAPCTPSTIFDLASLTKVIVTATVAMRAAEDDSDFLSTPIAQLDARWRGADRAAVTIRHLLDHSSGLPDHVKLYESASGRDAFLRRILDMPLAYAPGTESRYSDLGFILLGLILETRFSAPLDALFSPIAKQLGAAMTFNPPQDMRAAIAPTEVDSWRGRVLQGEVHDENAFAMGGVAGHAGLFGTADDVGLFAQTILRTFMADTWISRRDTIRTFATRSSVPGSSRALGWDTMLPTSSCGTMMSPQAIGHTGFTGTSLWIDPARNLYVVILSNRVHPTRAGDGIQALRRSVHDAVVTALQSSN